MLISNPKLREILLVMEANIEKPIALNDLPGLVGVSRRQIERLFQRYMQCGPSRYYLQLRVKKAKTMLLETDMQIASIAHACGFVSASHFSRCYRQQHLISPKADRLRAARLTKSYSTEQTTIQNLYSTVA